MTRPPPRAPVLSLDAALAQLLSGIQPMSGHESLPTLQCDGRVLAHDVVSPLQVPAHDNSAMDGYAVRSADVLAVGTALAVSQRIAAGGAAAALEPHTAARIFTGAPIPMGADAVVMQEETSILEDGRGAVRFHAAPKPGQNVRRAGEDVRLGDVVLPGGTRLGPAELGLAASVGCAQLSVARRPRVALFSTGDELVQPGERAPQDMPPGATYNSNRFVLYTLLARLGCTVTDLGIVPDTLEATIAALRSAAAGHDLILTSGGVSVGEEDHVKPAVQSLGALDVWQIAIKPGKPFAFGRVAGVHFIGLPGNPVSSLVTFLLLVRPVLLRLQGATNTAPKGQAMQADFVWTKLEKRREFLRVRRTEAGRLERFPNQSSGVLTSVAWADGLVDNPPMTAISPGDTVHYLPFSELFA